jgi:hypothetical protein
MPHKKKNAKRKKTQNTKTGQRGSAPKRGSTRRLTAPRPHPHATHTQVPPLLLPPPLLLLLLLRVVTWRMR